MENEGEPVTHDGTGFWQRARATLAGARDRAAAWVKDKTDTTAEKARAATEETGATVQEVGKDIKDNA